MTISRNIFSISVYPNAEGARLARKALKTAIADLALPKNCRDGLLLSTAEWITNLGEHSQRSPRHAKLTLQRIGGTFMFELRDDGSAFENFHQAVQCNTAPPKLDEDGMGLQLMARYFPAMTYVSGKNENRLHIQFHMDSTTEMPTILLVDDDPIVRNLYGEYVNGVYRCFLAESADEALQILRRTTIDLIVSDIRMPNGCSGLDLCKDVRRDRSLETIPFIFLTGEKDEDIREAAQGLAIDDYLLKPVRKTTLLSCTGRVIRNAQFIRNRLGDKFDDGLTRLLHPSLPKNLGGYNTAVHWQAAEAGGGDLLFHREMGTETLIVLADLMGHGVQAKFYGHALAGYLSGILSALEDPSPATVLSRLNIAFATDPHLSKTIATAIAVLLSDDGTVLLANAGHPQPLLIGPGGIATLSVSGPLLGLAAESKFERHHIDLVGNRRLFLFTDGLTEIGDRREAHKLNFGRIQSLLEKTRTNSVETSMTRLERRIEKLISGQPADDLTCVLLDYNG